MASCCSVTSLMALTLLGCLVGTKVEAQDLKFPASYQPLKKVPPVPGPPAFPQYPSPPQVQPPWPPKIPQYPTPPQVQPPWPPKVPQYPTPPQVQQPSPPKVPQYPTPPQVQQPSPPKVPQYPTPPQVQQPSPPKVPQYPSPPQVQPPWPPKVPQYPTPPQVQQPSPPRVPQYPSPPQVQQPSPPRVPQYPSPPQVQQPSPPRVPQYPSVPQVQQPSPPRVPQYPSPPQVQQPSPPRVPQYPSPPQVQPPWPPKVLQYPQVPQVQPPPSINVPPKVPQYPQVPKVQPPLLPPKVPHMVPRYPQVPQVQPPPSIKVPPKVPQYPQGPITPSPHVQTCDVGDAQKVPCGGLNVTTAAACQAISCCFDGQQCYFGKAVTVQCTKDAQFIVVVARDATLPTLDLSSVILLGQGQGCTYVDSNSQFAIYQFPVTACGSVVMEEPGVIIYQNRMSSSYEVGVGPLGSITRDSHYDLIFQCRYIGTSVQTVVVQVLPILDPPLPVAALGPIRVQLRLANGQCYTKGCNEVDAAYSSFYTTEDYPVTKVLRDPVYVEVELTEKTDPKLVLTLGRCWTTTTSNPHSLPQWDILING
ncbi:vegetative cell wall protein gp1-like [Micropterus dolomieu]|uniref:vegetative cell wall protein gp1-like n=1 Tax=Micropterus dolomieu TaxID=147949 RepID=UPI001E8EDF05|nr:vegetative cell wall protein gp1-like [Micropterus dolomieu]